MAFKGYNLLPGFLGWHAIVVLRNTRYLNLPPNLSFLAATTSTVLSIHGTRVFGTRDFLSIQGKELDTQKGGVCRNEADLEVW